MFEDKSVNKRRSGSPSLTSPKCHRATILSSCLHHMNLRLCSVHHDFQSSIFKAEHVCYWGHWKLGLAVRGAGTRHWSELFWKKHFLPLYKRWCKGLMRLIRTRGKNPIYCRWGPDLHEKMLNKLALKGEAQNRRLMLSSYGCSHTVKPVWADGRRSCRWMKAGGRCDTRACTPQVKHKQTIKPAASYRKTPLCNNLLFF